jgi:4-hydroxy-tetrahydrodipicolinate synthase
MDSKQFYGVYTALITPFEAGEVDYATLQKLVKRQIEEGVDGIVSVGTTGESPTLSTKEHIEVIRKTIEFAEGKVPVIAGTGANSTDEAIELTKLAEEAGADAFLQVAPYYNKPSQEGLYQHFKAVAQTTTKPIILYSIPGRCGIEIGVNTVVRLNEEFPHICALKESGASCDRVSKVCALMEDKEFSVLSGEDNLILSYMAVGAKGVICTTSNLIIQDIVKMVTLALNNDFAGALVYHKKYFPIFQSLFIEPNPVPVKYALQKFKLIPSGEVRLPLCPMSPANQKLLDASLSAAGVTAKKISQGG